MTQQLVIKTAAPPVASADLLVIYVAEGASPQDTAERIWSECGFDWAYASATSNFRGRQGQELDLLLPEGASAKRLLVLGSGTAESAGSPTAWTDRGGSLAAKLMTRKAENVAVLIDGPDATPANIAELAAGMQLRHYRFDKYKTGKKKDGENGEPSALNVLLHVADRAGCDIAIADRTATVEGTLLARDLVNEPANVLGTVEFAEQASQLSGLGITVEVLGEEEMRALGMGSLLAVAKGSVRPPRLVVMQWNGGNPGEAPLAFIGKGVVFDSGGISIKPAANMEDMKGDMGGAAAVTGLMHALARRKAKVNVVSVIGLVENMPDGNATRPGDIVTAMSGTTIEIINTDAEGRLVLADALWYTQDRFKPQFMINLATLTGAIIVALGHDHAGLFSNNDDLAAKLYAAGIASNEKLWRMPLGPTYDKLIESRFADIKNTGGRHGGSITAAQFLQRFVNDVPWAHLDIAGTAMGGSNNEINTSWGPGFGVAVLDRLIRDNYEG